MGQETNSTKFSIEKFKELVVITGNAVGSVDEFRKKMFETSKMLEPMLVLCKNAYDKREKDLAIKRQTEKEQAIKRAKELEAELKAKQEAELKAKQEAELKAKKSQQTQKDNNVTVKVFDNNSATTLKRPSYVKGKAQIIYTDKFNKTDNKGAKQQPANRQQQRSDGKKSANAQNSFGQQNNNSIKQNIKEIAQSIPTNTVNTKRNKGDKKSQGNSERNYEDKAPITKRKLIRKGYIEEENEDRVRVRKLKGKKKQEAVVEHKVIDHVVVTSERLTIKELSEKMGVGAQDILKTMLMMGGAPVTSINDTVDKDTMIIVADSFNVTLEYKIEQSQEDKAEEMHEIEDNEVDLVERPPVITVMGHVDHGKTSLLDAIRKANVASGEAGGITQHIGAYSVSWDYEGKKRKITFLDTPGHEAFTQMRARGAKATDIVVLVVAADDGVQPQTVEAINHVKAANCPMIVAINKIDKPDANIEKIKQDLAAHNVICDEWGGDVKMVPISAKNKIGIDVLLEEILFLADYLNFRANPNRKARGIIVEAGKDAGRGAVATILVQNGTLYKNDAVVCGTIYGKIRTMTDYSGKPVKSAGPSSAVVVTGLSDSPIAGDGIWVVENEKVAKEIAEGRIEKDKILHSEDRATQTFTNETQKTLNVIIKTDVMGSCEALSSTISKLENEEVKVRVVHSGVGTINKSDMMLAEVSNAMVIGFNVKPDAEARQIAEQLGIFVGQYKIIYDAIDAIEAKMNGMTEPKYKEVFLGRAEVRAVFKVSNKSNIAGSYVLDGKINRNARVIVKRGDKVLAEDTIAGLKRFKDDVKEVSFGYECGITLNNFDDFEEGDIIEAYIEERIN